MQCGSWKFRMIRGVWEMLSFEGKTAVTAEPVIQGWNPISRV